MARESRKKATPGAGPADPARDYRHDARRKNNPPAGIAHPLPLDVLVLRPAGREEYLRERAVAAAQAAGKSLPLCQADDVGEVSERP